MLQPKTQESMDAFAVKADSRTSLKLARVAFTGKLASMTRRQAHQLVRRAGGQVMSTVSRRTTALVVGMDGWPVLSDGTVSRKLQRAEELNRSGAHTRIVPEAAFLELVGEQERRPEMRKGYAPESVSEAVPAR